METSYKFRRENSVYEPFPGAVFADTFQAFEEGGNKETRFLKGARARRNRLKSEDILLIVGNPPYFSGQKSENDNNKALKYEKLDSKIRETYAEDSMATNKNSLYDSYIRAIKWATEKIHGNPEGGIVSFVTNASFLDNASMDGLRYHLQKDFTDIYIFNLRGNQRTKGEESKREGGKIFGGGSRCPIAISFPRENSGEKGEQNPLLRYWRLFES